MKRRSLRKGSGAVAHAVAEERGRRRGGGAVEEKAVSLRKSSISTEFECLPSRRSWGRHAGGGAAWHIPDIDGVGVHSVAQ